MHPRCPRQQDCAASFSTKASLHLHHAPSQQLAFRTRALSSAFAGPSTSDHQGFYRPVTRLLAKRREIDTAYFGDLYDAMVELSRENPTSRLPHMDLLIMINSIDDMQEAAKTLNLIARQVASRVQLGEEDPDWHMRKKYLVALMVRAWTKLGAPQVAFEVMANPQRYKTAQYFCRDVIVAMSDAKAPPEVLMRLFEINKVNKPPADKGVRAALRGLADALKAQRADAQLQAVVGSQAGRPNAVRFQPEIEEYLQGLGAAANVVPPPVGSVAVNGAVDVVRVGVGMGQPVQVQTLA